MDSREKRIFHAVANLINERDPALDKDEIKRQALALIKECVRVAPALSNDSQLHAPKQNELEQLHKHAEGLADALENLSFGSRIELHFVSDPKQLPNPSRLQLDARDLGDALQEGLKKKPRARRGRRKDFAQALLIKEATNVFEQASGASLNDLPKPPTQQSRNIKRKYYLFVRTYMPAQRLYESRVQFDTLKKAADRYLIKRLKK